MKESKKTAGHLMALFTVAVWGTTFISTKVLITALLRILDVILQGKYLQISLFCNHVGYAVNI